MAQCPPSAKVSVTTASHRTGLDDMASTLLPELCASTGKTFTDAKSDFRAENCPFSSRWRGHTSCDQSGRDVQRGQVAAKQRKSPPEIHFSMRRIRWLLLSTM